MIDTTILALLTVILSCIAVIFFCLPKTALQDIADKYILITGCDSGFGRKLSIQLDQSGCNVFACCLTKRGEEDLASICSDRLCPIILDITKDDHISNAVGIVSKQLPKGKGLWGIVNNAGIGSAGAIEWTPMSKFKAIFNVNCIGMVAITKAMLPFIKLEQGRIVNLSSMSGRYSFPYAAPYGMSKFGVEAFSDALRREAKMYNVSVHIIEPGYFKTNITDGIEDEFLRLYHNCNKTVQQDYGDAFVKEGVKTIGKFHRLLASNNLDRVVALIKDALFSPAPKTRYVVGFDSKSASILAYLPSAVTDYIINISGYFPKPHGASNRQ